MSVQQKPASPRKRLEDVAKSAGVSKSIASRVLNADPGLLVRPETRARVVEAAERLNYRPHAAARGLKRAETGALGFLVPPLTNPVYLRIIRGAFRRALERDFVVLLVEDVNPVQAEGISARLVQTGRIDGLVVASAQPGHPLVETLRRGRIPHVFVNRGVPRSRRNVVIDEARASTAALDHLVDLGHDRIGHVAGPQELDTARRRTAGFVKAAGARGLAVEVEEADFGEHGGAEAARRLLGRAPHLTALYTSTLSQAVGVYHAAWELGLEVPRDLSLVGYDDMPLAEYLRPPLTTVRTPLAELGAAAVDALVDQLLGGDPRNVVVDAEPEVVVRSSTGRPR
ncbi:MAG TPA: LacI family DNA-binding transcriptional regulator [Gaiellaceae bacterium]|nr:LacI family DNA-binding transcriptional regulator [Gaiellaceae bacterium]